MTSHFSDAERNSANATGAPEISQTPRSRSKGKIAPCEPEHIDRVQPFKSRASKLATQCLACKRHLQSARLVVLQPLFAVLIY